MYPKQRHKHPFSFGKKELKLDVVPAFRDLFIITAIKKRFSDSGSKAHVACIISSDSVQVTIIDNLGSASLHYEEHTSNYLLCLYDLFH